MEVSVFSVSGMVWLSVQSTIHYCKLSSAFTPTCTLHSIEFIFSSLFLAYPLHAPCYSLLPIYLRLVQYVHSTVCISSPFPLSLSPFLSFLSSMASFWLSPSLCPIPLLTHTVLSYIMHVQQTDMPESLRRTAGPWQLLPKAGGRVTSQKAWCAVYVQLNYIYSQWKESIHSIKNKNEMK